MTPTIPSASLAWAFGSNARPGEAAELARVAAGLPALDDAGHRHRAELARRGLARVGTRMDRAGREVFGEWEPTRAGLAALAAIEAEARAGQDTDAGAATAAASGKVARGSAAFAPPVPITADAKEQQQP